MTPTILPPGVGRPINVLGDHMTVRLTGAETGGAFTLVEQANPPGVGIPMHVHGLEDELFHVIEGEMAFTVAGRTTVAGAGTSVFLPRGIPHAWAVVGDGVARTLLQVFPAGAEGMWQELAALPPPAGDGPPDMGRVAEICGRYGVTFPDAPKG